MLRNNIIRRLLHLSVITGGVAFAVYAKGWGFWTVVGAWIAAEIVWTILVGWKSLLNELIRRMVRQREITQTRQRRLDEGRRSELVCHVLKFRNVSPLTPGEEGCDVYVDMLNSRAYLRQDDMNWTVNGGAEINYGTTVAELRSGGVGELSLVLVREDHYLALRTTVEDMAAEMRMRDSAREPSASEPGPQEPQAPVPGGKRVIDLG